MIRPCRRSKAIFSFFDSIEIKQENDIKQEPVCIGDLIDIPASNYRNPIRDSDTNVRAVESDFDYSIFNEVKGEMKDECEDKKEDEPKKNADCGDAVTDGQEDQQPQPQAENELKQPRRNGNAQNTQKSGSNSDGTLFKKHKCNDCNYSTKYQCNLNKHLLKHTGEKPHKCRFCPKRFAHKPSLSTHMKVHVEELLFHCSGCLEGFNENGEKTDHVTSCKVHRYECHLYKDSFGPIKSNMIRHMRVHSGDKPFKCNDCFKQFTRKSNLSRHKKHLDGPRSFRCSKCQQRIMQQSERNVHEERCTRSVYECDICGKSFGLKKFHLINHMRTHTGEKPFQCKECQKNFAQKNNLKMHMKIHAKKLPFKCLICRHGFLNDSKRKTHERNCNGRYYECHLCKKFVGSAKTHLFYHMRTHSGEKPFHCCWCQKIFSDKSNLTRHMKRAHKKNC